MTRSILSLLAACSILLASGCAYTNIRGPYDINIDNTDFGTKVGRASNYSVLWLVAWGDAGYKAAADDGGITLMKHSDYQFKQYLLGFYAKQTTIVYGD